MWTLVCCLSGEAVQHLLLLWSPLPLEGVLQRSPEPPRLLCPRQVLLSSAGVKGSKSHGWTDALPDVRPEGSARHLPLVLHLHVDGCHVSRETRAHAHALNISCLQLLGNTCTATLQRRQVLKDQTAQVE